MYGTKNFKLSTDPKLGCTCGHPSCDKRVVRQEALDNAQLMRDDLNQPMTINSGGRCPNHPNEKHKEKPGDHQECWAIDFKCEDPLTENKIKTLAGRHGATRVAGGWEDGFVHVAWTPTERKDVPTWSYS